LPSAACGNNGKAFEGWIFWRKLENEKTEMSNREILVLDDFTEAAEKALATAGRWRSQLEAMMASLHVSDNEKDHEQHRNMLRDRAEPHSPDHPVKPIVGAGNLFNAIREGYLREHPMLLVFCTHGVKGLRQLLFGANSTRVVDDTTCPTLVIQEKTPDTIPQRWLVSANTTWDDLTLNRLATLAGPLGASCTLLRISVDRSEITAAEEAELARWAQSLNHSGANCNAESAGRDGFGAGLAHQIYEEAVNNGYDLIVMSRSGYPLLGKASYDADRESLINNPTGIPVLFI
jgi:nucleotide-binding universal stress UspA family protein